MVIISIPACDPKDTPRPPSRGGVVLQDPSGIFRPGEATDPIEQQEIASFETFDDDRLVGLRVNGRNAECWSLERLVVEYDPARIRISLFGGFHALPKNTFCTAEGVLYEIVVRLEEPVGHREIQV